MTVNETLAERQKTHGNFPDQAATAQALKDIMRATPNWPHFPPFMRESIEHILTKLSRSGHGDWRHKDNAHDCSGYSELWERSL